MVGARRPSGPRTADESALPGRSSATIRPPSMMRAALRPAEHVRVVLGDEHRDAVRRQPLEQLRHRPRRERVELGGRLVQHEHLHAHDQDAGDGHALLLAARELEGEALGEVADAQALEGGVDAGVHRLAWHAHVLEAEGQLLAHGRLGRRELVGRRGEDDAHAVLARCAVLVAHGVAEGEDVALHLGADHARDEARGGQGEGRLAGAVPAGQPDQLAGVQRQVHLGQGIDLAAVVAHGQAVEPQGGHLRRSHGRGHATTPAKRATR